MSDAGGSAASGGSAPAAVTAATGMGTRIPLHGTTAPPLASYAGNTAATSLWQSVVAGEGTRAATRTAATAAGAPSGGGGENGVDAATGAASIARVGASGGSVGEGATSPPKPTSLVPGQLTPTTTAGISRMPRLVQPSLRAAAEAATTTQLAGPQRQRAPLQPHAVADGKGSPPLRATTPRARVMQALQKASTWWVGATVGVVVGMVALLTTVQLRPASVASHTQNGELCAGKLAAVFFVCFAVGTACSVGVSAAWEAAEAPH